MIKPRDEKILDFLRAFISGGVNQDFRPWARELYEELRKPPRSEDSFIRSESDGNSDWMPKQEKPK